MSKRLAACALLLFCALSLYAANDADLFAAGREAMRANDVDKAAGLFEKAIAANPSVATYHYWLGSAYGTQAQKASLFSQAGLAKKAKAELERAVQLDANYVDARLALMQFYLIAPGIVGGSEEKAIEQANALRKLDPLAGHRAWSVIYRHQKKPELASQELVQAVREQPNSAKTHYYLGLQWINDKKYPAAQHEFEMALQLDATYMPAQFRLGQLAVLSSSNFAAGEEALKKYLAYKPSEDEPPLGRAWYWLGGIYEKLGKKGDAKSAYQRALALIPGAKDASEALKRVS